MSKLCVIRGCPANSRKGLEGDEIQYFKVLEDQVEEWNRVIPGAQVKLHDRICSRHFQDDDIIKDLNLVIDDKTVTMSRGKWAVKKGSVPSIIDNLEDGVRVTRYRKTKPTSFLDHASSSDESEWVEPCRKRPNTGGSKHAKKRVTKNSSKSSLKSDEAAEVLWEEACDDFVTQLNSLCSPRKLKRGRPRRYPNAKLPKAANKIYEPAPLVYLEKSASLDAENAVIIEQFVVSSCEENESNKNVASNGYPVDSDEVVILTDPESPVSKNFNAARVTVKTEKCDDGYEDCHHAGCSVSGLKGSRHSGEWVSVVVKREVCDCDGTNPVCCEPVQASEVTISELPASPCEASPDDPIVEGDRCEDPNILETSVQEVIVDVAPAFQPREVNLEQVPLNNEQEQVSCPKQETSVQTPPSIASIPHTRNECSSPKKASNNMNIPNPSTQLDDSTQDQDFLGFSSGEEEELPLKRNFYRNSSEMASKTTKMYFDKVDANQPLPGDQTVENQSATSKEKSTEEIALAQLSKLRVMKPSMKPVGENLPKSRVPFNSKKKDPSNKKTSPPGEEVLKNCQPDAVTSTKQSNSVEQPDKLTPNANQHLDKIPTSSCIKLEPSKGISTVSVATPIVNGINSSQSSQNTTLTNTLKDKLLGGPATDKLAHLLNGTSLDRILKSTKPSLTDSQICDPTVDKTSLILKNFKSDGVLALEVVVLKEQVRQLQKELFLHKQMLVDSEHNASLLRSRLELQSQLPCSNCMTLKRDFVRKETLI